MPVPRVRAQGRRSLIQVAMSTQPVGIDPHMWGPCLGPRQGTRSRSAPARDRQALLALMHGEVSQTPRLVGEEAPT